MKANHNLLAKHSLCHYDVKELSYLEIWKQITTRYPAPAKQAEFQYNCVLLFCLIFLLLFVSRQKVKFFLKNLRPVRVVHCLVRSLTSEGYSSLPITKKKSPFHKIMLMNNIWACEKTKLGFPIVFCRWCLLAFKLHTTATTACIFLEDQRGQITTTLRKEKEQL